MANVWEVLGIRQTIWLSLLVEIGYICPPGTIITPIFIALFTRHVEDFLSIHE